MEPILSRDDAIQEHFEISHQLSSIIPYDEDQGFIDSLPEESITEYFGLSFANHAVVSIFHECYVGIDDKKLRIKSNK